MSITTSKRLEMLSSAISYLKAFYPANINFNLHKPSDTLFNLIVSRFPHHTKYQLLTIDLESEPFLEIETDEEMRKLILIELTQQATSVTIDKNITNGIDQTLFNIKAINKSNYDIIAKFINELNEEHKEKNIFGYDAPISLNLRFEIVQPTYNEEGLGSSTYVEKINPIIKTFILSFNPDIMRKSPLEELGMI